MPGGPSVSPRTRRGVHAFLLVFAIAGIAHIELYPFTGFRLFSELRGIQRTTWDLQAVAEDGTEVPIVIDDLPLGYHQSQRLIHGMDEMPRAKRDAICDAWTRPLRDRGVEVVRLRVYRTVANVRPEGPPPVRALRFECGGRAP